MKSKDLTQHPQSKMAALSRASYCIHNEAAIAKWIAVLLCIITMTVSLSIYWTYEALSISQSPTKDFMIYIAAAKSPWKGLKISLQDPKSSFMGMAEIGRDPSAVSPNLENVAEHILLHVFILFLSFISLASLHNFILGMEADRRSNARALLNRPAKKTSDSHSASSAILKESVEEC